MSVGQTSSAVTRDAPGLAPRPRGPWPVVNIGALAVCLAVNAAAVLLPLFGRDTGAISDGFDVRFKPAGYVFSIWSVIYLGLLAFLVYQARPGQRDRARLAAIDRPFALSCAANALWLVLWHALWFPATIVVMLGLLGTLIVLVRRLDAAPARPLSLEWACVDVPFRIYLGWITVATIANATIVLADAGWDGSGIGPDGWAIILLAVGAFLAAVRLRRHGDVAFAAVLVWAFAGIAVAQAGTLTAKGAQLAAVYVVFETVRALWNRTRGRGGWEGSDAALAGPADEAA